MLVDVLIPTYRRPAALAVTLTSLAAQTFRDFRIVLSDQTEESTAFDCGEVRAVLRVLELHGHSIELHRHLPRRGMAEHRQYLLDRATARYALFLDDDLILESDAIARLVQVIERERCGFVGAAVIGLSYADDVRENEQAVDFWDGPVRPEAVRPGTPEWDRWRLHNAANLLHVERRLALGAGEYRLYHVAWCGAATMYDRAKLVEAGGFGFWRDVPAEHAGEDVVAQLAVMERYGACGVIPSGVYHQELPTTINQRDFGVSQILAQMGAA